MKIVNNILLKILGVLLLTAAVMKGWQLLTEPVANKDIWTNRAFLIFTVEFELALGIWLLSGIFKNIAWLAALACFSVFSVITLYKGLSGAESCGCFGSVQVNPWVTLFVIDLPAVIALIVFRQSGLSLKSKESTRNLVWNSFTPLPSIPQLGITTGIVLLILGTTAPLLAFNKPVKITSSYEVLEPETWVGKELPISEYIDIGDKFKKGNWLILFYHYDCPDCQKEIAELGKANLEGQPVNIAIIEVPPYGSPIERNCFYGRLTDTKAWFITTPTMILIENNKVQKAWKEQVLKHESITDITKISAHQELEMGKMHKTKVWDKNFNQ